MAYESALASPNAFEPISLQEPTAIRILEAMLDVQPIAIKWNTAVAAPISLAQIEYGP